MKKLLASASVLALMSLPSYAGVDYTFADGQIPAGCSNSAGTSDVINGNLHVEMALQSNDKYRSDIKFDNTAAITLNPTTDKYLAIKFNGQYPEGAIKMEFNDGTKWHNPKSSSAYSSNTKFDDSNKNKICYFTLTNDTEYTGDADFNVDQLNIIIADNVKQQNYSVDWIKTFASEDDIKAYKDTKDDGEEDYAVWNETTSTGSDNLLTAINDATSTSQNCILTVRQNSQLIGNRATINATELTIQGSDPRITVTRDNTNNMFFLVNTSSAVKLNLKDLTLDGQNQTGKRMVEAANAGGGLNIEGVTFRNTVGNQTGAAVYVQKTTTLTDCKFINVTNITDGVDKGAVFMAANGLTLKGNNTFENCGVNIYNDGNYDFTNSGTNNTTPINITIDPAKKALNGKVVGSCHEPWKYVINNDGYCLLYNGKDNHLYLAEGYAANISDLGYATFYGDETMNLTIPEGVEVYTCEVDNAKENVYLIPVESIIPADTPVLLYSETPMLYQFVKTELDPITVISENSLEGSAKPVELNGAEADYYLLTRHEGAAAFKHIGEGSPVTSAAHKAYISLPKSTSVFRAPALQIGGVKETTGFNKVNKDTNHMEGMFNVNGQKVDNNYRGVVIRGGNKYIQK